MPLNERSVASSLHDGGYATWHVGKWHLDEAISLIRNRDERPFFLNLWHYAVHTPIQAPPQLVRKYEEKARRLGIDRIDPFEEGEHFPCLHKRDQRVIRRRIQSDPVYAAMIENLDRNIGRLLAALDDEGLSASTLVVLTSDNGGLATAEGSPTCNAPLSEGKGWMYEGGTRVVQLVQWIGTIPAGSECTTPVTSADWYPTLLDAACLPDEPTQHLDGESVLDALRGNVWRRPRPLFWHYPHYSNQGGTPAASVRDGDYKLIRFFEDTRTELYNLREDVRNGPTSPRRNPSGERGSKKRWTSGRRKFRHSCPGRIHTGLPTTRPPVRIEIRRRTEARRLPSRR